MIFFFKEMGPNFPHSLNSVSRYTFTLHSTWYIIEIQVFLNKWILFSVFIIHCTYVLWLFNQVVLNSIMWGPLGKSLRPFQAVYKVKTIFHNNNRMLFAFSPCLICIAEWKQWWVKCRCLSINQQWPHIVLVVTAFSSPCTCSSKNVSFT